MVVNNCSTAGVFANVAQGNPLQRNDDLWRACVQAMIEELFGSLGRAGLGALEHRRYRVITQQLPSTGAPRPRRPVQHM